MALYSDTFAYNHSKSKKKNQNVIFNWRRRRTRSEEDTEAAKEHKSNWHTYSEKKTLRDIEYDRYSGRGQYNAKTIAASTIACVSHTVRRDQRGSSGCVFTSDKCGFALFLQQIQKLYATQFYVCYVLSIPNSSVRARSQNVCETLYMCDLCRHKTVTQQFMVWRTHEWFLRVSQ